MPRRFAIGSLTDVFHGTKNRVIQNAIARAVKDEDMPTELRNFAYGAIIVIESGWAGDSEYSLAQYAADKAGFQLPLRTIDQDFLNRIEAEATADKD